MTTSGDCFPSQDAKHKNKLRQLHAMGSLFDCKYSQWDSRFVLITVVYLKPNWKSTMELFCKNGQRLKAVNYFFKKLHRRCLVWFGLRISSLLKHIKCQWTDLQSRFSVKLSDNSKVLIMLYYHSRSTIQRDKLKNRAIHVK